MVAQVVAAAAVGDATARTVVDAFLDQMQADPQRAALAQALRGVIDHTDDPTRVDDLPDDQAALLAAVRRRLFFAAPPDPRSGEPMTQDLANTPDPIVDRVAELPDPQAVRVLQLVLERRGLTVDPFTALDQNRQLEEALAQPEILDEIVPDARATEGDLARTALIHLLHEDPTTESDIDRAIGITADGAETRDPLVMVGVGALVLLAFRADIDIARDPEKGWKFRFKTRGLSDSTIGKLLGELLGHLMPPKP